MTDANNSLLTLLLLFLYKFNVLCHCILANLVFLHQVNLCVILLSLKYLIISAFRLSVSLSNVPVFLPCFLLLASIPFLILLINILRSCSALSSSTISNSFTVLSRLVFATKFCFSAMFNSCLM